MTNPSEVISEEIKATFQEYIKAFNTKKGSNLLPFFHNPILLVDREKNPVILDKSIIGRFKSSFGFKRVFKDLEKRGFDHSELDNEPQVKLLSEKLGIITGNAIRYKTDHFVLERFGYTYTFRKTAEGWKIVTGIIHD
jgi:ketosteroid isomerase-like protein